MFLFHKLHLNIYMLYTQMYTNFKYIYKKIYIYIYHINLLLCIQSKFVQWKLENASCPRSVAFTFVVRS